MRPSDIEYRNSKQHYFDIANGEVLAGLQQARVYADEHDIDRGRLLPIGSLLKETELLPTLPKYEPVEPKKWSREKCVEYGRWINKMVVDPEDQHKNRLTEQVFKNANRLGLGPSNKVLRHRLGSFRNFYDEIGVVSARRPGNFSDWDITDFIDYIREVGGETRPTINDFKKLSKSDPSKPKPGWMHERFQSIGGFIGLVELAGYTVVERWKREDYLDWGVKFMKANDGHLPTSPIMNFFATKRLGPSNTAVRDNFSKITAYQEVVARTYWEQKADEDQSWDTRLADIDRELCQEILPLELFVTTDDLPAYPQEEHIAQDVISSLKHIIASGEKVSGLLINLLGKRELAARYARYMVVKILDPGIDEKTKVKIATDSNSNKNFTAAFRRHSLNISAADIENTAQSAHVFDYIWPMDEYMDTLRLDEEYNRYHERMAQARKVRGH